MLYVKIRYMCVACGIPTSHTMSLAQWFGVISIMSFGVITFISCWWIITSSVFKRKLRLILDYILPDPKDTLKK